MGFERLPHALRLGLYGLAVAILLFLCLAPSHELPSVGMSDKWEHSIAWAVLAGTGLLLWPRRPWVIALFSIVLGGLVEVLQGLPAIHRDSDWRDWVADGLGVGVALLVSALMRRAWR